MFSKRKCPNCGARNSKERTACIECGAPLHLGRVDGRLSEGLPEAKPNLASTMKQSASPRRSAWFWVGVILLSTSALLWLILISASEDIGETVLAGVIFTAIPIGIGIYGIRRGRKPPAVEIQTGYLPVAKDTQPEVVIKMPWWFRVIAWGELLFGLTFFIGFGSASLADPNSETLIPAGFGLFFILLGIWMVGMTTKVTFDRPPGYMTVTRGHCALFLWFLRTKRISRDEARSVFIGSSEIEDVVVCAKCGVVTPVSPGIQPGETVDCSNPECDMATMVVDEQVERMAESLFEETATKYNVMVVMRSGKKVKLYDAGWKKDKAVYLGRRIRDFAPIAELEFSPDAKFSMRVDAAIQGIDRDFNFNGSYDPIELGEVSLARARELMRRLPDEEDVGPVSKDNKDLCPPNLILSLTRMVKEGLLRKKMVGQSIVLNLAGGMERGTVVVFDNSTNIFDVQMSFSEADEIISDFFRKGYEELAA